MRSRKFWFLALFLLLTVSLGSAELTVYEGDSVTISDANSTIIWGQDYTFDVSTLYFYDTALGIGTERNISIRSDTDAEINSTLNTYDFSTLSAGDTVFRFETDAVSGSQLDFRFTGVPSISEGEYRLRVDNSNLKNFSSGGTISWSYGSWSSNHSFELVYTGGKPSVDSLDPDDTNVGSGEVELTVDVTDDSESLDLKFFDGSGDLIQSLSDVSPGEISVLWDVGSDQSYNWYVEVSDAFYTVTSSEAGFSTIDFKISWNDTSDNENGFKIYSNSTGSFQLIGTVNQNVESFTDSSSSLEFGETVCYRIRAYNSYGKSPPLEGCATP